MLGCVIGLCSSCMPMVAKVPGVTGLSGVFVFGSNASRSGSPDRRVYQMPQAQQPFAPGGGVRHTNYPVWGHLQASDDLRPQHELRPGLAWACCSTTSRNPDRSM